LISDGPKFANELNESATKTKGSTKKSHSVTQAGDTLKKVAMLTKKECRDCG